MLRPVSKPKSVTVSGKVLNQPDGDGYMWKALDKGGVLKMKYTGGSEVVLGL